MFAHKIMDALKNLDFITDMYSLNDNTVCVDSNSVNFAVVNKFNGGNGTELLPWNKAPVRQVL